MELRELARAWQGQSERARVNNQEIKKKWTNAIEQAAKWHAVNSIKLHWQT